MKTFGVVQKIWVYTGLIIGAGLMALYSASFHNVRVPQKIFYDQLVCAGIGFLLMYAFSRLDYRRWYDWAYVLYFVNILLLIGVLVGGRHALGARRWLVLGPVSFQPSELTKLALILMLGRYWSHRRPSLSFNLTSKARGLLMDLGVPLFLTGLSMVLIFKQPDLGTALLMFGIFLAALFVSGLEYRYLLGFLGGCAALLPLAWRFMKPYQKDRLLVFLNPNIDPLGAGYTITQSKIAIGSGRVFGKGWLAGTQNQLNFLPERHTDFIFSVIGEEWGLIGGLFVLVLYFLLIDVALKMTMRVKDRFGMLVAIGIIAIFTLQVVINIGMVMGMFPIVGLTLPLISYGRSSFVVFMMMIGILLSLARRHPVV